MYKQCENLTISHYDCSLRLCQGTGITRARTGPPLALCLHRIRPKMENSFLPWEIDPDAGWKVKTKIKTSGIPGAGLGRYVLEDATKGSVLWDATVVEAPARSPRPGTVLLFHNQEELVNTFKLARDERSQNVYAQVANFGGALPVDRPAGTKFDDKVDAVAFCVPSVYCNHRADCVNIFFALRDTGQREAPKTLVIAGRDILAGEELFRDYREIVMPTWFKEFCRGNSFMDLNSFGYKINPRQ